MRKLIIFAAVVVLVLVGVVAIAVVNLEAFVNANREALAQQVESAVGRRIAFGEVGVSWAGGLGVRVADLRVGEDPDLAKDPEQDFLSADAVDVQVNLLSALFGKIEVTRVILRSPRITVIQTAKGLSTDSLGGGDEPTPEATDTDAEGGSRELRVSLVDVRDGELRFIDRTVKPPATFEVKALDVRIPSYSPSEPVELEISAAVAGAERPNLELAGSVGPLDAASPAADLKLQLDPLQIAELTRLSLLPAELTGKGALSLEAAVKGNANALAFEAEIDAKQAALRYGESFDKPAGVALELELNGNRKGDTITVEAAQLRLDETRVEASGTLANLEKPRIEFTARSDRLEPQAFGAGAPGDLLRDLVATGSFTLPASGPRGKATVRSPEGVFSQAPYRDLKLDVTMAGGRATLDRLTADAFQGTLEARGTYNLERSAFDLDSQISGMRVEELLATRSKAAAALLSGELSGKLDLRGAGSGWEEIKRVLDGSGELRIADGVLGQMNPAREVFQALALLPNFGSGLTRFLDAHPKIAGAEEAAFEAMTGRLEIQQGWMRLRDFVLGTSDYDLLGNGRVSLDGELDLKTLMAISQALSEELVTAEPNFRYLRSSSGRVELPVAIGGTTSQLRVFADVSRIASSAGRELLTDALTGALGGARPGEEAPQEPGTGEAPPDSASEAPPTRRDPLREALGSVLGAPPPEAPAPPQETPPPEPAAEPSSEAKAPTPDTESPPASPGTTPEEASASAKQEDLGNELLREGL
ncbi:MAG: AsmA family protein, partial [Myxococcota bacterium]